VSVSTMSFGKLFNILTTKEQNDYILVLKWHKFLQFCMMSVLCVHVFRLTEQKLLRMEKYDSIPSLSEQQTSSRVFTCLVIFAEVICHQINHHWNAFSILLWSSKSWIRLSLNVIVSVNNYYTTLKMFHGSLDCLGLPGWAGIRKVKPIWIYWSRR